MMITRIEIGVCSTKLPYNIPPKPTRWAILIIARTRTIAHKYPQKAISVRINKNTFFIEPPHASLNINHVNNDILTVIGKGNKDRKIFLTPAAKKSINSWMQIRNTHNVDTKALFISRNGGRITTRAVQNIVKKYVIASGLDPAVISTHKLRHTAATLMYKYGRVDIRSLQQILGHESIATTELYTHIDDYQLHSAVNFNPFAMMFN